MCCVLCVACGGGKPSRLKGAPTVPPDDQYETDGTFGYRVLSWTCYSGEHVVIAQSCGEGLTGCSGWTLDRAPCGTMTAQEIAIAARRTGHNPIPPGYGWR